MNNKSSTRLLIISLVLITVGSLIAGWINTGMGAVTIKNIEYVGTNGFVYGAYLYIPDGVTNENPAPGVITVHGGDAQKEIMGNLALELARHGYVVLNIDQPGSGVSDNPSGVNGMGGADALEFLRTLDIVDIDNIGIVGMSMGGNAICSAAAANPDGYKAIGMLDTACQFDSLEQPLKNVMLTWGLLEEHPTFFYGVDKSKNLSESAKLQSLFNITESVKVDTLYGSIEDGTARIYHFTNDTHLTNLDSSASFANIIEWFQLTLDGGWNVSPSDQIFQWKNVGTFTAFVGLGLLLFATGGLLLQIPFFKPLVEPVPAYKGLSGSKWWIGAVLTTVLAPLTYVVSKNIFNGAKIMTTTTLWSQSQINRYYLPWAILLGSVTLVLILINHFAITKKNKATLVNYGLAWEKGKIDWGKVGKSFLLAICTLIPAYLILSVVYSTLKIDFRLNLLAIRPMTLARFHAFLGYLIPFLILYLLVTVMFHGFLRWKDGKASLGKEMLMNVLMLMVGIVIWMVIQYATLFVNSVPALGTDTNFTIRATTLLFLYPLIICLSTYFFRKTGHVYVGAFLIGIFMTWYLAVNSMISVAL